MYKIIDQCRICGNLHLVEVVNLGEMMLTGVFPKTKDKSITVGPMSLVKCMGGAESCGLLQLRQSYDLRELYGLNYGYRSGLNKSMVDHLHGKVKKILSVVPVKKGDLVIDIGSNDGTTLAGYPSQGIDLVGINPTSNLFPISFQRMYWSRITELKKQRSLLLFPCFMIWKTLYCLCVRSVKSLMMKASGSSNRVICPR